MAWPCHHQAEAARTAVEHVTCECGVLYCTTECKAAAESVGHRWLCASVGCGSDDACDALLDFERHVEEVELPGPCAHADVAAACATAG